MNRYSVAKLCFTLILATAFGTGLLTIATQPVQAWTLNWPPCPVDDCTGHWGERLIGKCDLLDLKTCDLYENICPDYPPTCRANCDDV